MARKPPRRSQSQSPPARRRKIPWHWPAIVAASLAMHWIPLTSADASIQWDAVDVHYSAQKYFADSLGAGELPHWTPYIFSGFPFLADPQTGAWYPLNWPFFLAGVTPRAIQGELALHTLIAAAGAFLLTRRWSGAPGPAVATGITYAMSGFFAGHASHVGMSQAAAWLPWLLLAASRAIEERSRRWTAAAGAIGGMSILAGHFQTALYSLAAAALWAAALCVRRRDLLPRAAATMAAVCASAAALAAVQVLPGLELARESIRASIDVARAPNAALTPASLATLAWPNALGAIGGKYTGPPDVTQHYLYAGLLLIPLAAFGLRDRRMRLPALALLIPAAWYAIGPAGGFYRIVTLAPGFASVRAPVHGWFVCALALAILAGAGAAAASARWKWAEAALPAVLFLDVFLWNSLWNPMAYARNSFDDLYGGGLEVFRTRVAARAPEGTRIHASYAARALGPQNHALDSRAETTYGYNPLRLTAYSDYIAAAESNAKLLDTLGVGLRIHAPDGRRETRASALPRATFPKRVIAAGDQRGALAALDPAEAAVAGEGVPSQDPAAAALSIERAEQSVRVRYRAASPSLLRIAIPHFPGWRARVEGRELPVLRVDHALMGVLVPAGEREVELRFRSRYFALGAAISAASAILLALAWWKL
jgi:hypothetical protein